MARHPTLRRLELWRHATLATVRADGPDLTTRQMALLLTVYLEPGPHTVRGLAVELGVAKPVVTRALDTLGRLGFLKRTRDAADRRNVLVHRTVKGAVFLSDFADMIATGQAMSDQDMDLTPANTP